MTADLPSTVNAAPTIEKVTALPTLTPIVSCFDVVTVARPETGAVTE